MSVRAAKMGRIGEGHASDLKRTEGHASSLTGSLTSRSMRAYLSPIGPQLDHESDQQHFDHQRPALAHPQGGDVPPCLPPPPFDHQFDPPFAHPFDQRRLEHHEQMRPGAAPPPAAGRRLV